MGSRNRRRPGRGRDHRVVRGAVPATAIASLAAVLAGCSGSPPHASHRPTKSAAARGPAPTLSGPTSTTTSTATDQPVGPCTLSELAVTAGSTGAGLGHAGGPILFTNTGAAECSLYGYPGVAGLDAAGHQVVQARRTSSGYLGGLQTGADRPPTVDLAPGQTASAFVEGTDVPYGTPPPPSCPRYAGLLVTPPTATQSVRLAMTLPGCSGLEVHPVLAGSTGRSP